MFEAYADPRERGGALRDAGCVLLVALVSFLPFLRGALRGQAFFFRDLSLQFVPFRQFVAEGLRSGDLWLWNPFVFEGQESLPLFYPLDLVHLLSNTAAAISLTLAMHIPLAAAGAFLCARRLGLGRSPSSVVAIVYALGGFGLSCLNVYIYVQAMAWAPFVLWATLGVERRRGLALVALSTAVLVSTIGVEFVLLTLLAGQVLLPWRCTVALRARAIGGIALGCACAAPVLACLAAVAMEGARGTGFAPAEVVGFSFSPLRFLQMAWSNLLGDPLRFTDSYWAGAIVADHFPYFISIYLGPLVLILAVIGATQRLCWRWGALALLGVGVIVSLGRYVGLDAVVALSPLLRAFRFPSKAFFLVHLSVALLAGSGAAALRDLLGRRRLSLTLAGAVLGLVLPLLLVALVPEAHRWFWALLNPLDQNEKTVLAIMGGLAEGAVPLAVLLLLALSRPVLLRRIGPILIPALVAADLLRAGAGLNPMVDPRFYLPSDGLAARLPELRAGRVLSCDPTASSLYRRAFAARISEHELWTFSLLRDSLAPFVNMPLGVRTALGVEPTGLVPPERTLPASLAACEDFARIARRVHDAAVTHVIAAIPLSHSMLEPPEPVTSPDSLPLTIFLHRVRDPLRLWDVEGGSGLLEESRPGLWRLHVSEGTSLVVREAWARGWRATVDGQLRPVVPDARGHMRLALAPGDREVDLVYEPRWLRASLVVSVLSLLLLAALLVRPRGLAPPA